MTIVPSSDWESDLGGIVTKRCQTCHQDNSGHACKMNILSTTTLKQNCIDCHMPEQPSKAIIVQLQDNPAPVSAYMRTHLIKVYPDETKKFLLSLKKSSK